MQKSIAVIFGVFFVVGLLVLGISIKSALGSQKYVNNADRYLSVGGTASKIIKANGVIWPIEFINSDNNLSKVLNKTQKDAQIIKQFFIDAGVNEGDIIFEEVQVLSAKDGNDIYGAQNLNKNYLATQNVLIQSSNIQAVQNAQSKITELIKQDIVLRYVRYKGDVNFKYIYDSAHEKTLINEAMDNAKQNAQQIAERSNVVLGNIYNISVDNSYDSDYANIYLPSKQVTVRVNVGYLLK
ncbi:MAG: SIMPL domain-containing protein [Campylobacteraceae bacterium]|jgi:hypothetical protein|nr:SIMPL domain-containing protein [Campylobacteraceae bacterium]